MSAPRKVALVTGSATGIGRAVAWRFAKEGLAVAINYSRSQKEAEETLAGAREHGVPGRCEVLLAVADLGAHAAFLSSHFTSSRSTPSTSHAILPIDLGITMFFSKPLL
jgi:NAD(P)-dependent dehydrogenase (short-subunit alcohol dehydrogenase family)